MAITFNPTSLTVRPGYKSSVQITSTTSISSATSLDTSSMTVTLGSGTTVRTCFITVISAKNGPVKIRVVNSGGETVDFTVTLLGIDTSFVSGMLGIPSSDVGTLCKGLQNGVQKINKWSKWKPVSHPYFPRTEAILKQKNYGLDTKGIGWSAIRDYALTTYNINDPSTNIKWTYTPPSGGVNSPFVLDDFRGYDPGARRFYDCQRVAVSHPYSDGYGLIKLDININPASLPSQYSLSMFDFNIGTTYHLGVALIDYEANLNPTRLVKINSDNFELEKEITIDVTSLPTSTYIVVLFLQQSDLGNGLAQVLNPSEAYMGNLEDADYWWALEDGLVAISLSPFSPFTMWEARKYPTANMALAASEFYNYFPGTPLPTIDNTVGRMKWLQLTEDFSIEPKVSFSPSYEIIWRLSCPVYIYDKAIWDDNTWRTIAQWDDSDGMDVALVIKTVPTGTDKIIWVGFMDTANEQLINAAVNTGVMMPASEYTPSEQIPLPVMISISNKDSNLASNFTVTVDTVEVKDNAVAPLYGPPSFGFGDRGVTARAPRGLAYEYIYLHAEGRGGA